MAGAGVNALGVIVVATVIAATADWYAVVRGQRAAEYVAKPATTALLLVGALTLEPSAPSQRAWFALALLFCLAGDVFLMLPADRFIAGLASFLAGHLCFVAGFVARGIEPSGAALTTGAAVLIVPPIAWRVVRGARARDRALAVPVLVYIGAISALLASSGGSRSAVAAAGALMFVASDSVLAWNRFVAEFAHARLATMVTYHVALALLVLSLP